MPRSRSDVATRWIGAIVAIGFAALVVAEERGRGFPDGHVTDLDRALFVPRIGTAVLAAAIGGLLLTGRVSTRWLLILLAIVVAFERFGLPAIGAAMGLDAGGGG
jgi:membrane-associated phospholipid phosphatase